MTEPASQDCHADTPLDAICRNVLRLLSTSGTAPTRLRIESDGTCVELEWPVPAGTVAPEGQAAPLLAATVPGVRRNGTGAEALATATGSDGQETTFPILAPGVGTFYHAPEPGAPAFVRVGEEVVAGRQVGILEVMKLMTPVAADRPGRVAEFLVADKTPVEYGQPLIVCTHR